MWGFLFVIWGLILSLIIPDAFREGGFFGGMTFLVVAWGPTALITWYVVNKASNRKKSHDEMLEAAGVKPGSGADHAEDGTGIAINRAAKTLTLLIDGRYKTYPFADVREWETVKERAGQIVGVGLAVVAASARAENEAKANSGLFVKVKDIDNPKWRIVMKDEGIQARWMEILRQEINES